MNKKEMIQALETKWGTRAVYLGPPSFSYEIINGEEPFRVDRFGAIRNAQDQEIALETILNAAEPEKEPEKETEPARDEQSVSLEVDGYSVEFPMEGHTGISLRNLVNMLASKEQLLIAAFDLSQRLMEDHFAEELSRKETGSIEEFDRAFEEIGRERCRCLELDREKRKVCLKLLRAKLEPDEIAAFIDLAVSMNENALKLKTSSFRPAQEENPKYALRTWLIRLGLNGHAYKKTRKTLLSRLEGSSAFRSSKPENSSEE